MRWLAVVAVAAAAVALAGCARPGEGPVEPRCGESHSEYIERRYGESVDVDWASDSHKVHVEAGDPWRIVLESSGAFGHHGSAEVARHEAAIPGAGDTQRQRLEYRPFCESRLEFTVNPAHGPWVVTVLADPDEGQVPRPEEAILVAAGPGGNGTWEARVEPFWAMEPEFPGADHNGSRPGPWFNFGARVRTEREGNVVVDDYALAWGHAGEAVRVEAGLPAPFGEQPRTVRLVPLSPGLEPLSGDPASWVDEVQRQHTYYEVRPPANGTWRLGIQADWEAMDYPVVPAGTACWVLQSQPAEDLRLRWSRMDGPCR